LADGQRGIPTNWNEKELISGAIPTNRNQETTFFRAIPTFWNENGASVTLFPLGTCERSQQIGIEKTPCFGQSQHFGMKKGGFLGESQHFGMKETPAFCAIPTNWNDCGGTMKGPGPTRRKKKLALGRCPFGTCSVFLKNRFTFSLEYSYFPPRYGSQANQVRPSTTSF
jgi:hypothetical protein